MAQAPLEGIPLIPTRLHHHDPYDELEKGEEEPNALDNGCFRLTWVAVLCIVWTPLILFGLWKFGFGSYYFNLGWGASEADAYPSTVDARVDLLQNCVDVMRSNAIQQQHALNALLTGKGRNVTAYDLLVAWTQSSSTIPLCENPNPPSPPIIVYFLQTPIDTQFMYWALMIFAFVSSFFSAFVNNTAVVYLSNVVQDSSITKIAYSMCEVQFSRASIYQYIYFSSALELQLYFSQIDFLGMVIAGQLVFGIYLVYVFMEEKERLEGARVQKYQADLRQMEDMEARRQWAEYYQALARAAEAGEKRLMPIVRPKRKGRQIIGTVLHTKK